MSSSPSPPPETWSKGIPTPKVGAYITDSLAIRQIPDRLDLSPLEKPPPHIREVVRVPVDEEGREIAAQPA